MRSGVRLAARGGVPYNPRSRWSSTARRRRDRRPRGRRCRRGPPLWGRAWATWSGRASDLHAARASETTWGSLSGRASDARLGHVQTHDSPPPSTSGPVAAALVAGLGGVDVRAAGTLAAGGRRSRRRVRALVRRRRRGGSLSGRASVQSPGPSETAWGLLSGRASGPGPLSLGQASSPGRAWGSLSETAWGFSSGRASGPPSSGQVSDGPWGRSRRTRTMFRRGTPRNLRQWAQGPCAKRRNIRCRWEQRPCSRRLRRPAWALARAGTPTLPDTVARYRLGQASSRMIMLPGRNL